MRPDKKFDTQMVFLKEFLEKVDFETNEQTTKSLEKISQGHRVNAGQVSRKMLKTEGKYRK